MPSATSTHAERAAAGLPRIPRMEVSERVDEDEWSQIAQRCPYATFFHTPLWFRTFARTYPAMRVAARRFQFDDNRVAYFPLLEHSQLKGLLRNWLSSAASCYGGWISEDRLGPGHASAMARWVLAHCRNLIWRMNPLQPPEESDSVLTAYVTDFDSTEMLHLDDFSDADALRKHYDYKVRKQVNKAGRAGLQAREAESWQDWEAYYAIYLKRVEDWGASAGNVYPLALFRHLFEARSAEVKLWLVCHEGACIGGNLNFYHGRHCVEWHAAFDRDYFSCGVRDFLVDWIVGDAKRAGYGYYDFNPSAGHEGTRRFKRTFGTIEAPANLIVQRQGIYRLDGLRKAYRSLRRLRAAR